MPDFKNNKMYIYCNETYINSDKIRERMAWCCF
jgi:hypothetical protein